MAKRKGRPEADPDQDSVIDQGASDEGDEGNLAGGPGQPIDEDLQEIKIGGETFQVSTDVAEAIAAREKDFQTQFDKQGSELGDLRKAVGKANLEPPPKKSDTSKKVDGGDNAQAGSLFEQFLENPEAFVQKIKDEAVEQAASLYRQDKSMDRFWDEFYTDNPGFKKIKGIVNSVLAQNMDELGELQLDRAKDRLTELVNDEVLNVSNLTGRGRRTKQVNTESSTKARTVRTAPASEEEDEEDNSPKTLSEALRRRQRARHEAALGGAGRTTTA